MKTVSVAILTAAFLLGCQQKSNSDPSASVTPKTNAASAPAVAASIAAPEAKPEPLVKAAPEPDPSPWTYSEDDDEMRGTTTRFAVNTSLNAINLEFPYQGGSSVRIYLRKKGKGRQEAFFVLDKGQVTCGFEGCYIAVKFDNGPVTRISASESTGGKNDAIFIDNAVQFQQKLLHASKLIVEIPIYEAGRQQFKFDVSQLKWPK
ncbi:hypothetical protein VSR68_39565 [Paraburkholderia phymatum]|uniref:hypothetical protein n=1 Tax=Paraburkholderia phymatum TaxID=148447 RepID=UPI00317D1AF9